MAARPTGYDLLELQRRIARRVRHGGSEEDVEREIIQSSGLAANQLPSLRLYAASQLELHRSRQSRGDRAEPTP